MYVCCNMVSVCTELSQNDYLKTHDVLLMYTKLQYGHHLGTVSDITYLSEQTELSLNSH